MATTRRVLDLRDKWEMLNNSLKKVGGRLTSDVSAFPEVNQFASDSEFRTLVNALGSLRMQIVDLNADVTGQTEALISDLKHFYDISKDYESEIEIFKKGRDQAFQLYDDLSAEHRELLRAYEEVRDELKRMSDQATAGKEARAVSEKEVSELKLCYDELFNESSTMKVDMAVMRKKMSALEEENVRVGSFKAHEESDRNELLEKLSSETKSRNDALVLAEAARSELSRLLAEAERDRFMKQEAEQERDEAVGSVDGLNQVIEELKQSVEEQERLNKHEVLMRHKIETQLLSMEEENENLKNECMDKQSELGSLRSELENVLKEKGSWGQEKDSLVTQIATLAQHMAKDKQDKDNLMEILNACKAELLEAKTVSEDAGEKSKQMERIVNQLIQEKGALEVQIKEAEAEKQSIIENSKDVVNIKSKLDQAEIKLEELRQLFETEKKLKEESGLALSKSEQLLALKNEEAGKVAETLVTCSKERDSLKGNLEAVQRVLQGERNARIQEQQVIEGTRVEVNQLRQAVVAESQLKQQALSSLEAESRSKQEVIRQLEDARKGFEKNQLEYEKMKAEVGALKDRVKDDEREMKGKDKEIKQISKGVDSAGQAQMKAEQQLAAKNEELARSGEAFKALSKERDAILAELEKSEKMRVQAELQLEEARREESDRQDRNSVISAKEEEVRRLRLKMEILKETAERDKQDKRDLEEICESLRNNIREERQMREALQLEAKEEGLRNLASKSNNVDI